MTPAVEDGEAGPHRPRGDSTVARMRRAIEYCLVPARLQRTTVIAIIVGTILTLLNEGDVILGGNATSATAVKAGLNYLVPFVVSNLGLLSGRGGKD
ncbi:MAG TPA: nitrate/nitrite transporter NrtS [Candidatus Saccharimonadales bacterium]|nr:nitrate/nitrite transporter NrtS [Candidatus Saccharimonadales bacterium]